MAIIECIPNVSEGRRADVVERLAAAIRAHARQRAARLFRPTRRTTARSSRSPAIRARSRAAMLALFEAAVPAIDLRTHRGEHPRLGAVDVVPFVPIEGSRWTSASRSRRRLARDRGALRRAGLSLRRGVDEPGAQEPRRHPARRVRRAGRQDAAPRWAARLRAARRRTRRRAPSSSARACRSSPTTST